jgi:hypothetical protein
MHFQKHAMSTKGIVLVEPGVHLQQGHYREKLRLWAEGFRLAGWSVSVTCLEAPERSFLPDIIFRPISNWQRAVGRLLPNQMRTPWLVFCSFFSAFRYGKRRGHQVFGLTTSTLFPVAVARRLASAHTTPFAQIVMYGNMFERAGSWIRKGLERIGLNSLLAENGLIFPNTERTRQSLLSRLASSEFRGRVVTLYDPIYIPKKAASPTKKQNTSILLVPGPDNARRSSLFHLATSRLKRPPDILWIHAPEGSESDILRTARADLKFTSDIHIFADYKNVEAFAELFAAPSWCLVAYEPSFFQGSGLLAQAVVGGTPVLCSRFPYAEELFAKFGRLGELFTFGEMDDFERAWSRLRDWTPEQLREFQEAATRFTETVNTERITRTVVESFELASVHS